MQEVAVACEMLLAVDGNLAELATPIARTEAELVETKHLQKWVIPHPAALGEGPMDVSVEFSMWTTAGKSIADRLDVLAMDQQARLVTADKQG